MAPDPIARQVRANVQIFAEAGEMRRAFLRHRQYRAWPRVRLREPQEIMREISRQDDQIGLYVARREPRGLAGERPRANAPPFRGTGVARPIDHRVHASSSKVGWLTLSDFQWRSSGPIPAAARPGAEAGS